MNLAAIAAQAVAGLLFGFVGYILGCVHTRNVSQVKDDSTKPICMCKHGFSSHVEGRKCNVAIRDGYNHKIGDCACLLYVGPDPLMSGLWHLPPKPKKDS